MKRVALSNDIELSKLVYGMWRLTDDSDCSPEYVTKKIMQCLEQGITTFDQADIYGDYEAEKILGNALSKNKSLRNKIEIVTKCDIIAPCGKYKQEPIKYYDTSTKHLTYSVESSLTNLCIDSIDLLLLHRPDPLMNAEETGKTLDELITSGKIKAAGVSNFKPWDWTLLQSRMQNRLLINQIEFSLIHHDPLTNGDLSFHYTSNTPIMAWSPLGGGKLIQASGELLKVLEATAANYNADIATIAIAWLLACPMEVLPILGTNKLARIENLSKATKINMDRKTWYKLYSAALGHEVP